MWRSMVARSVWDAEAGGSSPLTPTRGQASSRTDVWLPVCLCGCSSVGRAPAFQAGCHGFESRRPLSGPIAQRLEPPAHNRAVPGSNPGGPISWGRIRAQYLPSVPSKPRSQPLPAASCPGGCLMATVTLGRSTSGCLVSDARPCHCGSVTEEIVISGAVFCPGLVCSIIMRVECGCRMMRYPL